MTLPPTNHPISASSLEYRARVDAILKSRFCTSIRDLSAESVVEAARFAEYSPKECVDWLAMIDGL